MKKSTVIWLIILVLALAIIPLAMHSDAEFGGADDQAEDVIEEINPDYEPWFEPVYEPASGEIESALFALQAAIGAGIIGYYFGKRSGQAEKA